MELPLPVFYEGQNKNVKNKKYERLFVRLFGVPVKKFPPISIAFYIF